jgi:hypothetical protein
MRLIKKRRKFTDAKTSQLKKCQEISLMHFVTDIYNGTLLTLKVKVRRCGVVRVLD